MGTLVNVIAIVAGGLLGTLLNTRFNEKIKDALFKAIGVAVLFIGINGTVSNMAIVTDGHISTSHELLLAISLAVGCLVGESIKLDDHLNNAAKKIGNKFSGSNFAQGFVTGTIIYCVGAMAIIGSLNDGLLHQPDVLYTKSLLDGITSIVLGATSGIGVVFSAIPVLIYQGAITLGASFLSGVLVEPLLSQICMVGYALVFCIGINFLFPDKIKVANLLPALLVPVIYNLILMII